MADDRSDEVRETLPALRALDVALPEVDPDRGPAIPDELVRVVAGTRDRQRRSRAPAWQLSGHVPGGKWCWLQMDNVRSTGHAVSMRFGRGERYAAGVMMIGAVALEVAPFLRWQDALYPFGHADDARLFGGSLPRLAFGHDGWSAATLPSLLLALLGIAALTLATLTLFRGHGPFRHAVPVGAPLLLAVLAAGAIALCLLERASTHIAAVYILRGYSSSPSEGPRVHLDHTPGVLTALIASVLVLVGAACLLPRRRGEVLTTQMREPPSGAGMASSD